MSAPSPHPRRRPQVASGSSMHLPSPTMTLRKSTTFSPHAQLSSNFDPVDNAKYLPRRSATCNKTLHDLVLEGQNIEPDHQTTLAKFLNEATNIVEGRSVEDVAAYEEQVLAVPRVVVNQVIVSEPMDIDKKSDSSHHHYSDSGIGSSVETPRLGINITATPASANTMEDNHSARSSLPSITTARSAITKSFSLESSLPRQTGPQLSKSALRQIHQKILEPILEQPSLKEFHPLVNSIPQQVDDQFITNLRDLEKTFLYSAPKFSLSPDSFTKFWEFSIRCLHSTVEYLADRDQRRPSDRPYTNNYFIDLVEQIRRYADIMARTREKEANGEDLDEMDFSPDERITIDGGLSKDGRPAELVRNKNGQTFRLAPENEREDGLSMKRPFEDDDDNDDVLRSMARRRKSDRAGDVMHSCSVCRKEFKRPCDLTKHEKTHSRPFKCTERTCRFYELGWPTEKERDRHINDKHSSAPQMYHCLFEPCTYASKRESNCKQHMEKTHNWKYIRSKSNGRRKIATGSVGSVQSPVTPFSPFVTTPSSAQPLGTPESLNAQSPWMSNDAILNAGFQGRRDSTTTAGTNFTYSSGFSAEQLATLDALSPTINVPMDSPLFGGQPINFNVSPLPVQQPTPPLSGSGDDLDFDAVVPAAGQFAAISPPTPVDVNLLCNPSMNMFPLDEGFIDNTNFTSCDFLLYPETGDVPDPALVNWFDLPGGYQYDALPTMDVDLFESLDGKCGGFAM